MSVNSVQQFLNVRDSHLRVVSGNVHADQMVLGGITVDTSHGLQSVTDTSNVTTNTIEFSNATTAFVTTANATIGGNTTIAANATIGGDLTVSGNTFYSNNTSINIDSNVVAEFTGPHARLPKTVPLRKYPEIAFEDEKIDRNDTTNTYTQAGYTVSASGKFDENFTVWTLFDESEAGEGTGGCWIDSPNTTYAKEVGDAYGGLVGNVLSTVHTTNTLKLASNTPVGAWFTIELPNSIKLDNIQMRPRSASVNIANQSFPKEFGIWGYDGNVWTLIKSVTGHQADYQTLNKLNYTKTNVNATTLYKKYGFVITRTNAVGGSNSDDRNFVAIGALKLYGYEEDPPVGDISVDTTFKSILNTPQTTGANVYVDAKLSSDFTNQVTGPTSVGPAVTHDNTNKYWEMNGQLTSNITVEANTFLSGDAPHSISMWFNSSNLESNASNSCIFSLNSGEERFDHIGTAVSNTYQTAQKITASDGATNEYFGAGHGNRNIAMIGDGSVVVSGAKYDNGNIGAVYVFVKDANGHWNEVQKLTASDATADDLFGAGVDISSDGNYIAIGARMAHSTDGQNTSNVGKLYIFKRTTGTNSWVEQQILSSPNEGADDHFGRRVSISSDGTYVVTACQNEDHVSTDNRGAAYVFKRTGTTWATAAYRLVASDAADGDFFGSVADISDDGNFIAIGAGSEDGTGNNDGSVYMFARTGDNTWTQQQKINNPDVSGTSNYFGGENHGVSISSDGTYLIVGAYGRGPTYNSGAVFFFKRTGSSTSNWTWTIMSGVGQGGASSGTYTDPTGTSGSLFGRAVRMSPDGLTALVHSRSDVRHDGSTATDVGAVHLYTRTGDNWTFQQTYWSRDYTDNDHFGSALDISTDGSYFVAGMLYDDDLGSAAGAAYIFTRDTTHTVDTKFDLQANTWHNLTYAYQGEGGSRVTYLDGRKVAQEQAFDSFQVYPPFSMTSPSLGGYKATSSSANSGQGSNGGRIAYKAFRDVTQIADVATDSLFMFNEVGPKYDSSTYMATPKATFFEGVRGEWIKLEVPERIKLGYMHLQGAGGGAASSESPEQVRILASNDDVNWDVVKPTFTVPNPSGDSYCAIPTTKAYKYIALQVIKLHGQTSCQIRVLRYYGHRENDLVRLPDPTNVLKYPHITMTGPAQRGYVASASSDNNGNNPAYKVFDHSTSDGWSTSGTYTPSGGFGIPTNSPPTLNGTGVPGEYLILQLPHKLRFSSVKLMPRNTNTDRCAESGNIYGSDDGTNWQLITSFSGKTYTSGNFTTIDINASTAYYRFAIVVTRIGNTANGVNTSIGEIELYGTGVDSIPIQIGGGNIDKVANFRVYNKFIEEDQALEIWDAQKDEFGRVKSSMTLHKGRLGLGTEEPEGRLAVADEPDLSLEGLQEFPPGPMSTDNTYIEGHGMFKSSASTVHTANNDLSDKKYAFRAFDQNDNTWYESYYPTNPYNNSDGSYTENAYETLGYYGEWLQLELPYKIKLNKFTFRNRARWGRRMPKEGVLLAFDKKVGNWVCIHKHYDGRGNYGITAGAGGGNGDDETRTFIVNKNTDDYYDTFRFVTTRLFVGGGSYSPNIAGWRLFGTRESINKQSVLHDGRLTLTKSLDVPRIGPPTDRDDTPRRDRLIAEFNTYNNPIHNTTVLDTSGRNHHATFRGLGGDDQNSWGHSGWDPIERAFLFNTSSSVVVKGHKFGGVSGDIIATISLWFRSQVGGLGGDAGTSPSSNAALLLAGITSTYSMPNNLSLVLYNDEVIFSMGGGNSTYLNNAFRSGSWNHLCGVKKLTGALSSSNHSDMLELYLNGKKLATTHGGGTAQLNIKDDQQLVIGAAYDGEVLNREQFKGHISGVKFYPGTALTAQEVYTLYSMGRNGKIANPEPLHIERPLHSPGTVVQVEHVHVHEYWSSANWNYSYVEPMQITIKPKFANSKMLIQMMINAEYNNWDAVWRVRRHIYYPTNHYHLMPQEAWNAPANSDGMAPMQYDNNNDSTMATTNLLFVDWPKTCHAVTYKLLYKVAHATTSAIVYLNRTVTDTGQMEHAISTIVVTEIAQ